MRWSYGDWEFFPDVGEGHFAAVNEVLQGNFDADEEQFERQIEPLWQALLTGFRQLEDEEFFGSGEPRSKITLMVVGELPDEVLADWVRLLNPPDVAQRFLDWDSDASE